MARKKVNITDVCSEIFAGGDAPKNRMSIEKTSEYTIPIYSNGEDRDGLYGYTDFARVNFPSITVSARGTIGYTSIRKEPFVPIVRLITITPIPERIDIRYLYYAINNFNFSGSGTSIPQLTVPMIKQYNFPLPPLEEQRKIAAVLDKVSDLIAKRRTQLDKLDELVKSRFIEMFGDFKINTMRWPVVGFNEIAIIDGNMTTDYNKYANCPHIGIDSIEKGTGRLTGYRTVAEDGVISGKYVFTSKHIIYSKIRPNLNKVALPEFDGLCSADAYPILPIDGKCNRFFLAYNMRSQFFLDYILQFCNRTNLPKVNRKEVAGFQTPLPPIELQNQFAAFVKQTDKSKLAIQKNLEKLEILKKSLMQKYFD